MLTDTALRNLKPKSKPYKASDRDGMYVTVSTTGTVTFRYDYRLNGRRETLTIGRYGPSGISLAMAREKLIDAKKAVAHGKSPAHEKQREKRRLTAAKTFGDMAGKWLADARMADSTKAMRKSIVDRDILPAFLNRQLNEITADDLRALCNKVKARGAPATAVHIRDIVKQVYAFAILHGEKVDNPAESVGAASIATFVPKDRALSPLEIRLMARQMESVATYPTIRSYLQWNGVFIGDPLTDNIADRDGYRFHDVFHFANAAILHWSPVMRALIRHKRKSNPKFDEEQDSGRAIVVEEGIAAWIFSRAKELNFFENQEKVSLGILKTIGEFVSGYEVEKCPLKLWEKAILEGYAVFRQLKANQGGWIIGSREQRTIKYMSLESEK